MGCQRAGRSPCRGRQTKRPSHLTDRFAGSVSQTAAPWPQNTRRALTTNRGQETTKLLNPQTAAASPIGFRGSASPSVVPFMRVWISGPIEKE
jgi:hypothetical protein